MPPISFTVRMTFPRNEREAIDEALRALGAASRKEPGCVNYIAHWVKGDDTSPDTVLIYEQYQDEAAVEAHRQSPHFQQYATGVLYKRMLSREVEHLNVIE
jgi:quinol monooxygenase YgiN